MEKQRDQTMFLDLLILGIFLNVFMIGASGSSTCGVTSIDIDAFPCSVKGFGQNGECDDGSRSNTHVTSATVTVGSDVAVDATDAANSIIQCREKTCKELAYFLLIQYAQQFCFTLDDTTIPGIPFFTATISLSYTGGSQATASISFDGFNDNSYFSSGYFSNGCTSFILTPTAGPITTPSAGSSLNIFQHESCEGQAAATTSSLTTQPPTTQTLTTQTLTTGPSTTQTPTTEPSTTTLPTTTRPETSLLSTTQPSATQPSATQTSAAQLSTSEPLTTQIDTLTPTDSDGGQCETFRIRDSLQNCLPLVSLCSNPEVNISAIRVVNATLRISDATPVDITRLTESIMGCSRTACEGALYEVIQIYSRRECLGVGDAGKTISIYVEYTYGSFTLIVFANDLFTIGEDGLHATSCDNLLYEQRANITMNSVEHPLNCSSLEELRYDRSEGNPNTPEPTEEIRGCPRVTMDLVPGMPIGDESCGATFTITSDSLNSDAKVSFESVDGGDVVGGAVNVMQDGIDTTGNHLNVVSLVIVIDIDTGNESIELDGSVVIDFAVDLTGQSDDIYCAFIANESTGVWSSAGMEVVFANSTLIQCRSNHLTSFAVLLSAKPPQGIHAIVQSYLSRVFGALSVLCLTLAVCIFFATGTWKMVKIQIHMNLAISTALGQLLFMTMAEMTWNKIFCKIIAVTLQYLFTAALAWTMIEGVFLYRTTAVGFKPLRIGWLSLFAWGGSLVVVGGSFGLLYDGYGSTSFCWLRHDDYTIYVFVGCVFAVLLFNSTILFFVMKSFLSLKANAKKDEIDKIKAMARALLILLPILGLTWFAGAITSITKSDKVIFFQYLFIISFGLQGVCIFIFHCLQVPDVKSNLKNRLHRKVQDSSWASKSGGPRSTATSSF